MQAIYIDYKEPYLKEKLVDVLSGPGKVSLRSIDWFITNYSKKNNIYYLLHRDILGHPTDEVNSACTYSFNVHQSYKSQLKAYSKKSFDPFCRRDRIPFILDSGETFDTTIGQLNFFRWAITNNVIDYIVEHKKVIEDDMNMCLRKIKEKSKGNKGHRKQREELSLSATRGLSRTNISVELSFN
jgi:hypothetical protein